jgi:hypothetical protein
MQLRWPKPRSFREFLLVAALSGLLILAIGLWSGPRELLVGLLVCPLALAWRYDNDLGTCFPLTLLFMITLAVMALLLYLMAVTH